MEGGRFGSVQHLRDCFQAGESAEFYTCNLRICDEFYCDGETLLAEAIRFLHLLANRRHPLTIGIYSHKCNNGHVAHHELQANDEGTTVQQVGWHVGNFRISQRDTLDPDVLQQTANVLQHTR